jgi:hypothetical protein
MPDKTIELIIDRQLPCVAFLMTESHIASIPENFGPGFWRAWVLVKDENERKLIEGGAKLLLANDMGIQSPTMKQHPILAPIVGGDDPPRDLGCSHIFWLKAAVERGMEPMEALRSATINIAEAYGKDDEIGTIQPGKRADLLVLDHDPLADPENYAQVALVIKDGEIIDRQRLPDHPVLTGGDTYAGDVLTPTPEKIVDRG